MSRRVDLDARRAARREARGESPVVVLGGEEFALRAELPIDAVELLTAGRWTEFMRRILVGGDAWERFSAHEPSMDDITEIAQAFGAVYGVSAGEAPASIDS